MDRCCANLGPRGRLERWAACAAAATTAVILLVVCVQAWPWVRVVAVVLVTLAALCGLQALHRTCVVLAFGGRRDLDRGIERVTNWHDRAILRRQAWRIVGQTLAVGAAASTVAVVM